MQRLWRLSIFSLITVGLVGLLWQNETLRLPSSTETTYNTNTQKTLPTGAPLVNATTIRPSLWSVPEDVRSFQQFPTWLQTYIEFHHRAKEERERQQDSSGRKLPILIWMCMGACGGAGDRISGIITAVYLSICTSRPLFVYWQSPDALDKYLRPNLIQWDGRLSNTGQTRRLQEFGTHQSVQHRAISNQTFDHADFVNASTLSLRQRAQTQQTTHIYAIDQWNNPFVLQPGLIPADHDVRLRTNVYLGTEAMRNQSCLHRYMTSHGADPDDTDFYRLAFWALFRWSPMVLQAVEDVRTEMHLTSPYVAIHLRTGRSSAYKDMIRPENVESTWPVFHECARKLQAGLQRICEEPTTIYLAADTADAKRKFLDWNVDDRLKTLPDMEIFHLDRSTKGSVGDLAQAELDVWLDLKLLMDSTCLVMTEKSKYSRLAAWLPLQPRCAVFWNDCGEERVAQELSKVHKGRCRY